MLVFKDIPTKEIHVMFEKLCSLSIALKRQGKGSQELDVF